MRRIFGSRKEKPPPPTLDEATEKLNTRGDAIDDKIRKLDEQLAKHREAIRRARPGPAQEAAKRRALTVLKQKKLYEGQRDQLYNQQFNVEQTSFALQNMQDSVHTVQAMQAAGKELKAVMNTKALRIENIEKMQDSMIDLLDMQNEINDVLGAGYNVPEGLDEDELLEELDALEGELAGELEGGAEVPSYLQEPDLPELPAAPARPLDAAQAGLPELPQRS